MSRTKLLASLSIALGFLVPLLLAEVVLRFLPVKTGLQTVPVNEHNPVLRFTPNRDFIFSKGWDFQLVNRGRTNNYGFVNGEDYDSTARTPLLAVIGDSQIEAEMVPFSETLQGRLAPCVRGEGRVYSIAVAGVPLSHYVAEAGFARSAFGADGVVIVIVGNDFDGNFPGQSSPGTYYFRQGPNGPQLGREDYHPSWGRRILRESALARYVILNLAGSVTRAKRLLTGKRASQHHYVGNTDASFTPQRLDQGRKAVDDFLTTLPAYTGLSPDRILLVVDAMRPEIYSAKELKAASGSFFDLMRQYVIQQATRKSFEVVDLQPRMIRRYSIDSAPFEFSVDHHWNGRGHQEAARAVASSKVFKRIFPTACQNLSDEGERVARP
jgi:hypothetical protein